MQGPGSLAGYRYLWHALRLKQHVNVPRNLVATIMKESDLDGVKERRSRRPKRRVYMNISKGSLTLVVQNVYCVFFLSGTTLPVLSGLCNQ